MNTNNIPLFSEFKPVTKQEWLDKVNIDLKGDDFNRKLVWKNLNDINIQPFYNTEDALDYLSHTGENSQALINYRCICVLSVESGNKQALKAIKEGVTGLLFELEENVSATTLLKGIDLNQVAVSFVLSKEAIRFPKDFFAFVEQNISHPKNLRGYIDLGLISNYVTKGISDVDPFESLASFVKLSTGYPNFKTITISGTAYLDAGSNQVQEVAYTLNSLVYLIEQCLYKDISVQSVFNNLHVQLAIGSEYFVEIGKFRAFNSLLHEIAKKYGVTNFKHSLTAKTSIWSKSVTDAHTNLLRATTEAMSAILGNTDGVLIDAYDKEFNEASDFSNRIAGNISTILKEESYLGKVANPVDGSYYIEEVSTKIADKALYLFKAIEAQGGFYKAFESEYIQQQIAEIRQEKIKLISQRRLPMVGVNKYPNLMETVPSKVLSSQVIANPKVLTPRRASLEIEALRKVTEQIVDETGKRPVVELTSFGNLTMRKARAAFSYDFIGVSGFKILQEKSFENVEEAAKSSAQSESDVVVICSSDADYDENALLFIETFRRINSEKVLLLAGNPLNILNSLTAAGLDGCIHLKSDVIQTISGVQKKIQKYNNLLKV
ncbi:methylmalonyl-CoA mutase family protein [Mariniflexile litorale]|uniref:Methylmalonyl-CoA mutase family protein n=1 Tax=Mariniflexile litorale TaxID=3045158 RepID=A0AAU7EAH7_9FLAO|nr:methylmalonyl-CoA mutase family protein [Mariniflexile sp. KMM 9835]MDQ8210496.1 methylmalonyl-CoA mutase family protein [Mariniflexile sp. KMM 9835]